MYIEPTFADAARLPISRRMAASLGALAGGAVLLGIIPFFYEQIYADTGTWLTLLPW